ncbi:MAG TPA: sulfatase, partial [Isosphaeraceae bacterium]|nr:sulfatase [Isosphaeraceae bacterium]
SPTRASLLTGKTPARLHLTDWLHGRGDRPNQKLIGPEFRQQLPLEEVSVAEMLRPAGYSTASIGKWHLGGEGFGPTEQGFQLNVAGTAKGSPPGYFARPDGTFDLPGLRTPDEKTRYITDRLTDEACKFLDAHKDEPFFLYLPHFAVHIPIQPRADLLKKYEAKDAGSGPRDNPYYAAMVESVDESVGRILARLDKLGIAEKTVVVFTSDNGGLATKEGPHTPATSNAPLKAGKGYLYEGGIREPWIVRWPGVVKPGSVCDVPISSIDFLPTVAEITGVKPPSTDLDGVSVVPLLKGSADFDRGDALYWHYPHYSNQGGKPGGAIREGKYKLIEFYEDDHVELYDLEADQGEENDLAKSQPEVAAILRGKLHDWLKKVDAQMPRRK